MPRVFIDLECGATTCASEPGKFCKFLGTRRFGMSYVCRLFPTSDQETPTVPKPKAPFQSTPEKKREHYRTWAAKPGNLETKAREARETYAFRLSLGICPRLGCSNDLKPGMKSCGQHYLKPKLMVEAAGRRAQKP